MAKQMRIDWMSTIKGIVPKVVFRTASRASDTARRQLNKGIEYRRLSKRYDAAATGRHNQKHWRYADGKDANSAIGPSQATLRNRARYEIRNNPYAKGIVNTFADDLIGYGPRLQIKTGDRELDRLIEREFHKWIGLGESIDPPLCDMAGKLALSDILRLAASLQQSDAGEGFILMQTDNRPSRVRRQIDRPDRGVRLRLALIEADRVVSPGMRSDGILENGNQLVNGIEMDPFGKPVNYYVLKKHPGSTTDPGLALPGDFDIVPAENMIHLMITDRAGQTRGVPEISPSLPLFAQMRDYTLSTISAAKTASNLSATLEAGTDNTDDRAEVEDLDLVDIERDFMVTLPVGWKMNQFKPEQPTTTYAEFKREIINEMARPFGMPLNVAAANSSEYNYASGRLDKQPYNKNIKVRRRRIEVLAGNRIFQAWFQEAALIPGMLKGLTPAKIAALKVKWFWQGFEHVDPVKEAVAQDKKLKNNTTNLGIEYGEQGRDWEVELEQKAKEDIKKMELELALIAAKKKKMEELGLDHADIAAMNPGKTPQNGDNQNVKQTEKKTAPPKQAA